MSEPGKDEPLSNLAASAAVSHELFVSYQEAGFSADQALYLVGKIVTAAIKPQEPA